MLSGEGNENGEKTIGLISKKATLHVQHTFFVHFFCRCFARPQRKTSRNFLVTRFMEEMSYVFLFTFLFFTASHFHFHGRSYFSFSHGCYKIFMLFFHKKRSPLFFISGSSSLSLFFSFSFAGLSPAFSFFLSFSFSMIQICGHNSKSTRNLT